MAVTYGFYNALAHDRRYNAIQMSSIFDGIINDGIFMSIGTCFRILARSGMIITVGIGRAWFNHTWTLNDSVLPLTVSQSEVLNNRYDAVILEVNADPAVRANSIKIIKGVPSNNANPAKPVMKNTEYVHQYPLAYIYVKGGSTSIRQADITDMVGKGTAPYVTGIIETVNVEDMVLQWEDQWKKWYSQYTAEYTKETMAWFESIKGILKGDIAVSLADEINDLKKEMITVKKSVSDGKSSVASAITDQGVTTAADATFAVMAANIIKVGTDKYNAGVSATKVGTAVAQNVLSGKTFTNSSSVGISGTMADYASNPQTVTLSSSQIGTSTHSLSSGYHTSVKVDATNVYNAGKASVDLSNYIITLDALESMRYDFKSSPQHPSGMSGTFVNMSSIYFWDLNNESQRDVSVRLGYGASLSKMKTNRWYTYSDIVSLNSGFASNGSFIEIDSWPSGSNMRVFAKYGV